MITAVVLKTSLWKERWYALQENFVTVGSDFFLELLADDDVLYLTDNGISSEEGNSVSETNDTGTSDAENIDKESADLESTDAERLIYIARFYANDTLYLYEENSLIIQVETKQYEEEERNGNYNDEYGEGDISSPLEQFLYELDRDNIEPHREEINTFFEENKSEAIDAMQNGEETAEMDVTDWFPETMILPGEQNTYTCHVSSVTMAFAPGYVTKENVGPLEEYPSRVYVDGEYYWYMSGVCFLVDGIME